MRQRHGLVYVLEGQAFYQMKEGGIATSFTAKAGNLLYLPPDASYITSCYKDTPFVHMTVNFQLSDEEALFMLPTCIMPVNGQKIQQIFARLVGEWTRRHRYYQVSSLSLLYELLSAALSETDREYDSYKKKLLPARNYLDEHFCESLPEEGLSTLCGMSETYFRRLFKRVYKESASGYRSRLRIGKACDLLLCGMYTVEEISEMCGYGDPAYFSRAFKKITGRSPQQYKKSNRSNVPSREEPS